MQPKNFSRSWGFGDGYSYCSQLHDTHGRLSFSLKLMPKSEKASARPQPIPSRMKSKNKIIKATAELLRAIHDSDNATIEDAIDELQRFSDSWLVAGDCQNLTGIKDCCLADTDITEAINDHLKTRVE